jgi:hypothetical protein
MSCWTFVVEKCTGSTDAWDRLVKLNGPADFFGRLELLQKAPDTRRQQQSASVGKLYSPFLHYYI